MQNQGIQMKRQGGQNVNIKDFLERNNQTVQLKQQVRGPAYLNENYNEYEPVVLNRGKSAATQIRVTDTGGST